MITALNVLIIATLILTVVMVVVMLYAIHSKAYLRYQKKRIDFENRKKRIEEDLQNDREKFKRNS